MTSERTFAVVGAGIFGVTAALALRQRGPRVLLFDPGPLPHPLAESTDLSKVLRLEYGGDEEYMALMEQALAGWRRWSSDGGPCRGLFHEVGLLVLRREPLGREPGCFENQSFQLLRRRGHHPERLDPAALRARFPAWAAAAERYPDGFYHAQGGFAESGKVVAALLEEARRSGVEVRAGERVLELLEGPGGGSVVGVRTAAGARAADHVVVAAGAWSSKLLPEFAGELRPIAQPVFHLRPADPRPYAAARFPVFCADITRLGYYGFPATPDGIVKIAHHGAGRQMDADDPQRTASPEQEERLREFLRGSLPGLLAAPIVSTRLCLYCDTWDGDFLIDRHPGRAGLTVAAGGSGHAFKFAPLLGALIAGAALDEEGGAPRSRFRWRTGGRVQTAEAARCLT